jgi:TIR domain-containing protein/SIR2-like protein
VRERDWDNLVWNVRRGRSVLFMGPHVGGGDDGPTAALARHLGDLLREEGRTVMGPGLPVVAQQFEDDPKFGRSDLEREVARFYETSPVSDAEVALHQALASLPFPLYLTSRLDARLEGAVRAAGRRVEVARYHFRGSNPPVAFANAPAAPLLYHLYGSIDEPPSLVLTERDVLEFLENVVAHRPGLPDAISGHLQRRDTTFLFLGFGLRHPYLRMLLHGLKVNQDDRSLAVEEALTGADPSDDAVLFYERGKITLQDAAVAGFVAELWRRFQAAGGAVAAPESGLPAVRPRIFISYASEDASQARRLHDVLGLAGFDAWLDKARLDGGTRWDSTIEQEIDRSDYILVLQSRALAAKVDSYVNKEIALARERALRVSDPFKCLIPLEIEPCERRQELTTYQTEALTAERYDDDVQRLVSLIKRDYQKRQRERAS